MITAEEIGEVPVLSSLDPSAREQLGTWANIEVAFGVEVAAVHGEGSLSGIDLREVDSGQTNRIGSSGLFIFIGASDWSLDRDPFLLETSVPGIFACGDVRFGPVKRVAAAVGEGSMSIAFVHQHLRELEPAESTPA